MRITCISDLHGHHPELPGGDLLIMAGDATSQDKLFDWTRFYLWFDKQPYTKKVYIAGNHDNFLNDVKSFPLKNGIEYLCDSITQLVTKGNRLKIWGSPWTKTFDGMNPHCKAFTVDTDQELAEKWKLIPEDTDILITHSPPYSILDLTQDTNNVGSISLQNWLESSKVKLHIFGHIHECGGKKVVLKRPGIGTENNILCINASHVNEHYKPVNAPITVEMFK